MLTLKSGSERFSSRAKLDFDRSAAVYHASVGRNGASPGEGEENDMWRKDEFGCDRDPVGKLRGSAGLRAAIPAVRRFAPRLAPNHTRQFALCGRCARVKSGRTEFDLELSNRDFHDVTPI